MVLFRSLATTALNAFFETTALLTYIWTALDNLRWQSSKAKTPIVSNVSLELARNNFLFAWIDQGELPKDPRHKTNPSLYMRTLPSSKVHYRRKTHLACVFYTGTLKSSTAQRYTPHSSAPKINFGLNPCRDLLWSAVWCFSRAFDNDTYPQRTWRNHTSLLKEKRWVKSHARIDLKGQHVCTKQQPQHQHSHPHCQRSADRGSA